MISGDFRTPLSFEEWKTEEHFSKERVFGLGPAIEATSIHYL